MRPYVLHWLERYTHGDIAGFLAPSWFTCVGLAGVAALALLLALGRRRGIDSGAIASIVVWGYVAAVLAGIAVPALIDGVGHLAATGRFELRWSGMTSFWGYLAGAAAVAVVCKRERLPLAQIADLAVIPIGVALALARIGCFMAGCDYGKISSLPWAVRFPAGSPAWRDQLRAGLIPADRAESLPVHPTELYEVLLGLAIVGIALAFARRPRRDGDRFVLAAASYAIGRLAIEALRGDAGRGIHAGLSSGQIFSLLVLLAIAARFALAIARSRAIAAAVVAALVLTVAHAGAAAAQPAGDPEPPLAPSQVDPQPAEPNEPAEPAAEPSPDMIAELPPRPGAADPTERPLFSTGLLLGAASSLNRRANQVATLTGATLSIGYLPGRFGLWIDLDALSSAEASHDTLLATGSFTQRPTRSLMLGVRAGVGLTLVNFKDPAFRDVRGTAFRLEAIAEYAVTRHWALWVRPLTLDVLAASELGGPITTYQFRIGVAYRFGSRRNAPRPADPPPPPALPQLGAVP